MAKRRLQYGYIKARPTRYKRILFRSRLEARWAMFLEHHRDIAHWVYEPLTLTNKHGWTYTPDFLINFKHPYYSEADHNLPPSIYLEIKPCLPSREYEKYLLTFSPVFSNPLILVYGDWYKVPFHMAHINPKLLNLAERVNTVLFSDEDAYDLAASHRFDLRRKRR